MNVAASPVPAPRSAAASALRLIDIESSLMAHFRQLHDRKVSQGLPTVSFAIEHGLDREVAQSLGQRLGSSLGDLQGMSDRYQLCWVVHAAEQGYNFGGLEYWDSFAQSTPNWKRRGSRETLRGYFETFSQQFGGARPSGGWAQHYKYICWPIAHALLPRDLQVQLAQAIYRARQHLYAALKESDESLGRVVAHYAFYPTHRFTLFLRDARMAGWIVRTLLEGEHERSGLEGRALERIVEDLRSEGHARTWLAESVDVYQQHSVRPHGGNLGMPPSPWPPGFVTSPPSAPSAPKKDIELEPRLSLVRVSNDLWKPLIHIPSFANLAFHDEALLDHVETNRVSVPCHGPRKSPASALLSPAGLSRAITTWPSERTPLLSFDDRLPVFDDLVKASVQLRPSSSWLFKIGDDGTARHVQGTTVLPGQRYVLVSRDASKLPQAWPAQRIDCEGVGAVEIAVPNPVNEAFKARLQQTGLSATYTVTIAPVGAVPSGWSSQSLGEWLTTQTPRLLLKRDHHFTHYSIRLRDEVPTTIRCDAATDQVVSLTGLREGRHDVIIETHLAAPASNGGTKLQRSVTLPIVVRQPRSWVPGRQPLPAMLVNCEPAAPTFSEFLAGRVVFRVDGDPTRLVSVRIDLLDGAGSVLSQIAICEQRLPVEPEAFRDDIADASSSAGEELDLLAFDSAQLVVDGGDLGVRKIVLQEAVQSLRWRYSQRKSKAELVLVDDLERSVVRVRTAPFSQPAQWSTVSPHDATDGLDVTLSGGLYAAVNADHESYVVVSPASAGSGFDVFRVQINGDDLPRDIGTTMETYRVWSSARVCGLASRYRQHKVLQELRDHGISQIAGRRWRTLEDELAPSPSQADWERMEASAQWNTNYGILLSKAWANNDKSAKSLEPHFVKITMQLGLAEDPDIARCAWRLAGGFQWTTSADAADAGGKYAGKLGSSMRGARLMHLFLERGRSIETKRDTCEQ